MGLNHQRLHMSGQPTYRYKKEIKNMPEPTTTATGVTLLIYKIALILLPIGTSLVALVLGLRFVPMRKGHEAEDMINRSLACFVSGFFLGIPFLVFIYSHAPGLFESAMKLADLAMLPPVTGFFVLTASGMLLCAIPGPWILAGLFLWLERRKGKDLGEMVSDVRQTIKGKNDAERS